MTLSKELADVLNANNVDTETNTADYVLAEFVVECLRAFQVAAKRRDIHNNDE